MNTSSFEAFEQDARSAGFDEAAERNWEAHAVVEEHTHPFEAQAVLVRGEMWLSCAGQTRHLLPGDDFHLAKDTPHAERYGPQGATYWVARRNR